MQTQGRLFVWCALAAVGCGAAAKTPGGDGAAAKTPASCEAMVDHRHAECPEHRSRLFDINLCEQNRLEIGPIGCTAELAEFVLCETSAAIDCESGEALGCEDELQGLQTCQQQFTVRTLCVRGSSLGDRECGAADRYSFLCINPSTLSPPPTPASCERVGGAAGYCCTSFDTKGLDATLFVDPVLGPDELPPDYSGIDFTNSAVCLDFNEKQGWGRCEQSSGCECTHCAPELAACAADYNCVIAHRCTRGGSCSTDDPFFTTYASDEALEACMEAAGCAKTCN